MTSSKIDLVCWDFGDTLVDEQFMRIPPRGCDGWAESYNEVLAENEDLVRAFDLGRASINDLISPLAERVELSRATIARHLRSVWHQIEWFPESRRWVERLHRAGVTQAVVTVNPHEFQGMAVACGLDEWVDVIVTSAEVADLRKPPMAVRARQLLGLAPGLETTVLIDNKANNTADFERAGGKSFHFTRSEFPRWAERVLAPLLERPGQR
ncbi:MAG: HAD family hydrolase [Planctomycetota bacterium]